MERSKQLITPCGARLPLCRTFLQSVFTSPGNRNYWCTFEDNFSRSVLAADSFSKPAQQFAISQHQRQDFSKADHHSIVTIYHQQEHTQKIFFEAQTVEQLFYGKFSLIKVIYKIQKRASKGVNLFQFYQT